MAEKGGHWVKSAGGGMSFVAAGSSGGASEQEMRHSVLITLDADLKRQDEEVDALKASLAKFYARDVRRTPELDAAYNREVVLAIRRLDQFADAANRARAQMASTKAWSPAYKAAYRDHALASFGYGPLSTPVRWAAAYARKRK